MIEWIISRGKEPSTWRVIAVLAGAVGYQISPELQEAIAYAVAGALGLIEVIRKEHKGATPEQVKQAMTDVACGEVQCGQPATGGERQTFNTETATAEQREATGMDR